MSNFVQVSSHCNTLLGIDLHTTAATYAAIDATSDTIEKVTIPNHCTGKILRFIQSFKRPICIGIESMGSYYWLWDMLKPIADEIHLLDALDLSKLRPRMADTDKISATKIAQIMKSEFIPQSYVPPVEIRHLRILGRQWHRITEEAAQIKSVMRWQISKAGSTTLRWALSEAAFEMTKFDAGFRQSYEWLVKRTGIKGKARTAMARRLARIIWKMVISETPFKATTNPDTTYKRASQVRQKRKYNQQKRREHVMEKMQCVMT